MLLLLLIVLLLLVAGGGYALHSLLWALVIAIVVLAVAGALARRGPRDPLA